MPETETPTVRTPKNVAAGSLLLDERLPGWRDYIDTDKLNLANGCDCVLGELFGDYSKGLDLLGLDHAGAKAHGFYARAGQSWVKLTAGWRKAVGR